MGRSGWQVPFKEALWIGNISTGLTIFKKQPTDFTILLCSTVPRGWRPEDSWDQRNWYSHFNIWVDYNHHQAGFPFIKSEDVLIIFEPFGWQDVIFWWHHGISLNLTKKFNKILLSLFKRICDVFLVNKSLKESPDLRIASRADRVRLGAQLCCYQTGRTSSPLFVARLASCCEHAMIQIWI